MASRVAQGGHGVPAEKIESRYARSLSLLPEVIARSNRVYLFDNSGRSHHLVAEFVDGQVLAASAELPEWIQGVL